MSAAARRLARPWLYLGATVLAALCATPAVHAAATSTTASAAVMTDGTVTAAHTSGSDTWIAGSFRHVGSYTGAAVSLDAATGARQAMPVVDGTVETITPDGSGGYYLGGDFDRVGGIARTNIAHVLPDGSLDPGFASGPINGTVRDIAVDVLADRLVVVGDFTSYGGVPRERITYVERTGSVVTTDPGHTSGFDGPVHAVKFVGADAYRTLWVGGSFSTFRGQARGNLAVLEHTTFNLSATRASTDIGGANAVVNDIETVGALSVLIGGEFDTYRGVSQPNLVLVLNTNASPRPDNDVTNQSLGADGAVDAMAVDPITDDVYLGGAFTTVKGVAVPGIGRFTGDKAELIPAFQGSIPVSSRVTDITVSGSRVFAVGDFPKFRSHWTRGVVSMDTAGEPDVAFAPIRGMDAGTSPRAVEVVGGRVIVGGTFRMFDAIPRAGLAKLASDGSVVTAFDPGTGAAGGSSTIHAIQRTAGSGDDALYVAGDFTTFNGAAGKGNIAKLSATTGQLDASFLTSGGGADQPIRALAPGPDDLGVFIGGEFDAWRGATVSRLAFVDQTGTLRSDAFAPVNPNSTVTALARSGASLYVGGHFTKFGVVDQPGIARFGLDGTMDPAFDPSNSGASNVVRVIRPAADGSIFIGGDFEHYQGVRRNRIARIDGTSGAPVPGFQTTTGTGIGFTGGSVTSLGLVGNRLYVGGAFDTYDGVARRGIAAISSTTGSLDHTFAPTIDAASAVDAISVLGTNLVIGGTFATIDGAHRRGLALLERTVDATPPATRLHSITEPAPGSHADGVVVKAPDHVVVNPNVAAPHFGVKVLAHDSAVSTANLPGAASGLERVDWPIPPAPRGAWDASGLSTPAAPSGLELDCWSSTTLGVDSAARDYDEAIDWSDGRRPDVTPSLPAILAYLQTDPAPAANVDRGTMSCRWRGFVHAPDALTGSYAFRSRSDGGFRANIQNFGGQLAPWTTINDWTTPGAELSAVSSTVPFAPGVARPITAEWFSASGTGVAALEWDPPGADTWRAVPPQAYASDVYYTREFTLDDGTGATTGRSTLSVIGSDQAANTTAATFDLSSDASAPAAPAGFTTSPGVGTHASNSITVTITAPGLDVGDAGVETHVLQHRSKPFVGTDATTCAGPLSDADWTDVETWSGQTTWTKTTAGLPDGCHQYRLVSRDLVGNVSRHLPTGIVDDATDWIRVDTTAPTAVTAMADGPSGEDVAMVGHVTHAGASWTPIAGIARYDVCLATGAGCSGTVERSWTSVGTASSLTWTDLSMDDAATYYFAVRAVDAVGNMSTVTSANGFVVDLEPADGTAPASPRRGVIELTGAVSPLLSGALQVKVVDGAETLDACTPTISGGSWSCLWDSTGHDGTWQVNLQVLGLLGGGIEIPVGAPFLVDNAAPVISATTITEGTSAETVHVHPSAPVVWIDPRVAGSFHVAVSASDQLGTSYSFPGFGTGWTPSTPVTGAAATRTYSWSTGAAQPTDAAAMTGSVAVADALLNTSITDFEVRADTTPPGDGTIDQHPGVVSVPQIDVAPGADSGSGVASHRVLRQSGIPLNLAACHPAGWSGPWTQVGPVDPTTVSDTTVDRGACYRYKLVTTDNVGNVREQVASGAVITDDHAIIPTSSLTLAEGGTTGSYSIRLHRAPLADVTLAITHDASQLRLYDVDDQPVTQLVFTTTNWSTPQHVYVAAVDDVDDEDDTHASTITHAISTTDPDYGSLAPITLAATIDDNDAAAISVSPTSGLDLAEGDIVGDTFDIGLATRPLHDVTITFPVDPQLSVTPASVTFSRGNWNVRQDVVVTAADDARVEGLHSSAVRSQASSTDARYEGLAAPDLTTRITDDDAAGIDIASPTTALLAEADPARTATYRVRLTAQPEHAVTISVTDALGQVEVEPSTLVIAPAAWDQWTDVVVRARQDDGAEPNPHVSRTVFTPASLDGHFGALAPLARDQEIVEDDVAAYVTTHGATWARGDGGKLRIAENASAGATVSYAPRSKPNATITITPALSHADRFTVTPAAATIAAGSTDAVTFTVRPVDDAVDRADLDAVISWNVATVEAMYSSVRIDDLPFTVVDDEVPPVDRTVREDVAPVGDDDTPEKTPPTQPRDPAPTPETREPATTTPTVPDAREPIAETPAPDSGAPAATAPIDDLTPVTTQQPSDVGRPRAAEPQRVDEPRRRSATRGRIARVKDWARENTGTAASLGVASAAIAGAAMKAAATKGLVGMFQGLPGMDSLAEQARHLRPRRFRKHASKLRRRGGSSTTHRSIEARRRRRRAQDPMREIFDRLDGTYTPDGPDILDRLEGRIVEERPDILDRETPNAGFEIDLDRYDDRAA